MVHNRVGDICRLLRLGTQAPLLGPIVVGHDAPNFRPDAMHQQTRRETPLDKHIVDRLRTRVYTHPYDPANAVMLDAADEIQRLQTVLRNSENMIRHLRDTSRDLNLEIDHLTDQLQAITQEKE